MQTIQFKVDNNYIETILSLLKNLNSLNLNVIQDLSIIDNHRYQNIENEQEELKSFSNHTANLIEEWKDEEEDKLWI